MGLVCVISSNMRKDREMLSQMAIKVLLSFIAFTLVAVAVACARKPKPLPEGMASKTVHDFTADNIDGEPTPLSVYKGKVLLIVNTASRCGFTKQYEGLQALYEKFKDDGLVVLGFPSNDFMGQEPGSNEEIKQFCESRFEVTFPMFEKIVVKGKGQHPLFFYLTDKRTNPEFGGAISWNFNKFLVNREGQVIARFGSRAAPESEEVVRAIETALKKG